MTLAVAWTVVGLENLIYGCPCNAWNREDGKSCQNPYRRLRRDSWNNRYQN